MAVSAYSAGIAHARRLVAAGTVDKVSPWSFSAGDGNKILGDPPKWDAYASWHMGHDSAANAQTKDAWKYPFGKNGKVYLSALRAIASRASAEGAAAISAAASALITEINKPKAADGMLQRAYSLLEGVKSLPGGDGRTFSGTATSPVPDRMNDVIKSEGLKFKNPLPLLLYHNSRMPVGEVRFGTPGPKGTPFEARISSIDRPGAVQDRINEALDSLHADPPLIRAVSIGFRPLEEPVYDKSTDGFTYPSTEVLELSMVVIPAHQDATIDAVKALDISSAAASGTADDGRYSPGVSGLTRVVSMRGAVPMKKSFADQIAGFEATRAAKAARIDEILNVADGTTLDASQKEEHDALSVEITEIDEHLVRLRAAQKRDAEMALEVREPRNVLSVRNDATISVRRDLPKGFLFARYAMCVGASRGIPGEAMRLARENYRDDPGIQRLIEISESGMRGAEMLQMLQKTAVTGGSTSGTHYLADMVPYNIMNDFIEFLRPGSIIGKFGGPNPGGGPDYPSLNRVGFNERVSGMSTGYVAAWKGEGLPALPTAAVTFNTALTWNCIAALAVLTKEAIRFSNPNAETRVRDDLARSVNYRMDYDFVDPAKAASGTTSPASITNGVVATPPTGTTAAFLVTDLATMIANFATNNLDPSDIVLIMSASMALQISMMTTSLGVVQFPTISMKGGSLRGFPVIVSENLTAVGSPGTQSIVAVKASDVYLADDGVVTVEASDQASIEMVDTSSQSAISGTGASLVSLWQTGAIGLMALREVTWKLRRATAVQYISPAAYKA